MATKLFWTYSISGDRAAHAARGVGPATDYETPWGSPVHAPFAGSVARRDTTEGGYGLTLTGEKYIFVGQHLAEPVSTGRRAHRSIIGKTGNTGSKTTGPHIHAYIIVRATGKRISFSEWLRDYVNKPGSAPKPAGSSRSLVGRTIDFGSKQWYWYSTAVNAAKFISKQGKGRGQNMLTGPYKVLAVSKNGSIQVQSNGNRTARNPRGLVWVHQSAANYVR